MNIIPVVRCKRCGKTLLITHAETFTPDPNTELLQKVMRAALEVGLCKDCSNQRAWYASQNRVREWEAGLP